MANYNAVGVTTRTDFPTGVGGGYSPLVFETDTITVGTALADNDTLTFMDIPIGYQVLELWVHGSTKLADAITINVGGAAEDDLLDGFAGATGTNWVARTAIDDGTNGVTPSVANAAAQAITITVEGSPTAAATDCVVTVMVLMVKATGQ